MSTITINLNDVASMLHGIQALIPTLEKMVSAAEASSVKTEQKRVGKPLTEEHKAKMKAGREKKAAEKAAAKALVAPTPVVPTPTTVTEAETEKPKRVGKPLTEEHKAKMKAGREKKAAEKAAAKALIAPLAPVVPLAPVAPVVPLAPAPTTVTEAEKPKRVGKPLTEEHKAKMKAGREKKAAEKAALTAAAPVITVTEAAPVITLTEAPKESEGEISDSGSNGSKRGRPKGSKNKPKTEEEKAAKKAKKASNVAIAASIPLPSSPVDASMNDRVISIKGRLFLVDRDHNAFTCIGTDVRGEYVGRYSESLQIIDDSIDYYLTD